MVGGNAHGGEQGVDRAHLVAEIGRGSLAIRLVGGVKLLAEGGAAGVEDDGQAGGGELVDELQEHPEEAENGAGGIAARAGQATDGVVGLERERVAVDEEERWFWVGHDGSG